MTASCPTCAADTPDLVYRDALLWGECPAHGPFSMPVPQNRRTDPLQDRDVRDREELTQFEKVFRRVFVQQKKAWGSVIGGLGALLTMVAMAYPSKGLMLASMLCTAAAGLLLGAGSNVKSDDYEKLKTMLLERAGKM